MRLKLFLVLIIATIDPIVNPAIVRAESIQIGRLIADRKLANFTLDRNAINTTKDIPSATDLVAKSKRKSGKPTNI
jgi:outer membrane protein insertion porin family